MAVYVSVANTIAVGMAGQWCIVFSDVHFWFLVFTTGRYHHFFSEYCPTQSGSLWCLIGERQSKTCCQGLLSLVSFTDMNWPLWEQIIKEVFLQGLSEMWEVKNYNPSFSSYSLNFKCSGKWQYKFVQSTGGQKAEILEKG